MTKLSTSAVFVLAVLLTGGCARGKKQAVQKPASTFTVKTMDGDTNVVVTPVSAPVGRVASVNAQARFVVLNFPVGQLPANDSRLAVFHNGSKTGVVKVTGPAQENFTVGDITAGTVVEGDEVRAE
jgi:hypothetical protein